MTNAEKHGMDEDEVNELTDKFEKWHKNNTDVKGYGEALFRFLQAEVKPTLTEDEKVILKNIDETKIKRFTSGDLFVYTPLETDGNDLIPFNHLFQFIQERRRI